MRGEHVLKKFESKLRTNVRTNERTMDAFLTKNYTSNKSFTPHFLSWPLVFAWKDTHQLLPRLPLPIQFREYEEQDWRVGAVTSEWAAKPKPLEVHVFKKIGTERRADGRTSGELTNGRTNERNDATCALL